MQHSESANSTNRQIRHGRVATGLLAFGSFIWLAGFMGCGPNEITPEAKTPQPFANVKLKLRCADKPFAEAITPIARVWAARTGASVEITSAPDESADLLIVPAAEIGAWAERGELLPVPAAIREAGHPYQWGNVLSVYRGERLAGWGGQIVALPLAGDGCVLVYRSDRFSDPAAAYLWQLEKERDIAIPTTWEDYTELAAFFSRFDGKPALPPLPADAERLADLFFRVAGCYDRVSQGEADVKIQANVDNPAFQFDMDSCKPRLTAEPFKKAASWLAALKKVNAIPEQPGEPVEALAEGRAVMGVLSLAELARLQRGGAWKPGRFGVGPLPGTRSYFDANGREQPIDRNYVPYFAGGRFGMVRTTCSHPIAAFDLLAEIGGPARSLELLSTPGLGAGPFRNSHLDRDRLLIWLGYGFDEDASKSLQEALRANVGQSLRNPVFGLRGPDQAKLTAALGNELKAIGTGAVLPEVGLDRVQKAWSEIDASVPPDQLRGWRRRAVGLN